MKVAAIISTAMKAEILSGETELELARRWRSDGDEKALHRLISAYMRLAVSYGSKYKRYGYNIADLIQEASIGLMKAAEKFDPERGVRFSTYATWWIKAALQDFVMRNWSQVRIGSTASQKTLFFNMHRVRSRLEKESARDNVDKARLSEMVASELGVSIRDTAMMEARLSGPDYSLNVPQAGEEGREWIEMIEDEQTLAEEEVSRGKDITKLKRYMGEAMKSLNERERKIIFDRQLRDKPLTLERLGGELNVSKERIRQIEAGALKKMKKSLGLKGKELLDVFT